MASRDSATQDAALAVRPRARVVELPPQLADQIAAGEVVARPSSVVKELLENALDAGARKVQVAIEGGGVQLIRVVDDGHGMDERDARLSLKRHATSKISRLEDLSAIATFGFRGEALPSIASVSKLTLRTREMDAPAGVALYVEGGGEPSASPWGGATGTSVEVADLFYNVPARRKFVRAISTESANVGDVVRAVALAHHDVHLELVRDGRQSKRWLRAATREERVRAALGDYPLVACRGERGPISVEAFLSEPGRARSGAGGLWIFVGDRPVQDRSLARAVASAYGAALAAGRYPVGAVFVALPPDLVDVNVHPQKAEVRFAHARAVTDALHQVLGAQLSQSLDLAPSATRAAATQPWHGGTASHGSAVSHRSAVSTEEDGWTWSGASAAIEPRPPRGAVTTDARAHDARRADGLRYVGRAGDHFLLFEDADAVLFVDARRAARATLSARAKAEWGEGRLVAQRLLFPATVAVGKTEAEAVERHSGLLARLGFDVRRTGPEVIGMHSVPRLLATVAPETLLAVPLAAIAAGTLDDDVGGCIEAMAKIAAEARRIDEREPLDRAAIAAGTVDRVTLGSLRGDR